MVLAVFIRLFKTELSRVVVILIRTHYSITVEIGVSAVPIRIGAYAVNVGHGAHGIDVKVKQFFLLGLLSHTGKLIRHKANNVLHTQGARVFCNKVVILDHHVVSECGDVLIHNGGHSLAKSVLKELSAGGTGACGVVIVGAGNLHVRNVGLIPEESLATELCHLVYPILDKLAVGGRIETYLIRMHHTVTVVGVRLGVIGEEVSLVAGSTADAPVVNPDLKPLCLGSLEDILHNREAALNIVVREHMYNNIHVRSRYILHIGDSVAEHSVAVVSNSRL